MASPPPPEFNTLYEADYYRWLEITVQLLKKQDFPHLDLPNLIEEIEGLAGKDKRELESRLTTLFEHLLKRQYVNLPECHRGWASTIKRTQIEINKLLKMSPSLKNHYWISKDECYQDAVMILKIEYDAQFPDFCPFPADPDQLFTDIFGE